MPPTNMKINRNFRSAVAALVLFAAWCHAATWYPVPLPPEPPQAKVLLPASRDYNAPGGMPVRKLFNLGARDPHIMLAPDGMYYMVATAFVNTLPPPLKSRPDANGWWYNDGIPLWRSPDLVHWETMGYVWTLDKDATWAKEYKPSPHTKRPDNVGLRAVWAPEIHFFKGTYWMPYAMNYDGIGVLKSTSGKPEGPYVDIKPDGPLVPQSIDASLFEDSDGSVYLLWNGYSIARMKPDMSGLAEEPRKLEFSPVPPWGEGINMQKIHGRYVFTNAGVVPTHWKGKTVNSYDCFSATSDSIYGPYTGRYRAIPHDGHQDLFQDKSGSWMSSYFGSGEVAPWGIIPGVVAVNIDDQGHIQPKRAYPRPIWHYATEKPEANWTDVAYDDSRWTKGEAGFGDPVIKESGPVTEVATVWKSAGIWMRQQFELGDVPASPALFIRYTGEVQVSINGRAAFAGQQAPDDYITAAVDPSLLHRGSNTIAIYCKAGADPRYIDAGLIDTQLRSLSPTALDGKTTWRFTTEKPDEGWEKTGFSDAKWKEGEGGFGTEGTPGAVVGTVWDTDDIWMRRAFVVTGSVPAAPALHLHHDEDIEVYINGVMATTLPGFAGAYDTYPMSTEAAAAIRPGKNVLAAHCHQTGGGQYVDVGIIDGKK